MPRSFSQRDRTASGTAKLRAGLVSLGDQSFVGRTGHLRLPSVRSAPPISFARVPSLPVSIGRTIGWLMTPGGGSGLLNGLPLYCAAPPLKTQSQPLPRVTAWWAPQRSAHRLPSAVIVQTWDSSTLVHAGSRDASPVA